MNAAPWTEQLAELPDYSAREWYEWSCRLESVMRLAVEALELLSSDHSIVCQCHACEAVRAFEALKKECEGE